MTQLSRLVLKLLLAAPLLCRAQQDGLEMRTPFPEFVPQPSATTLYCRATVASTLFGLNEGAKVARKDSGTVGALGKSKTSAMKLRFEARRVFVSLGDIEHHKADFPNPTGEAYVVMNDNPDGFFALNDRTAIGMLQTITLNRVTGTLVFAQSAATGGHPEFFAQYFVCGSAP